MKSVLIKLSKIFHTLKYLRFEQFYYRALYKFIKPKVVSPVVVSVNSFCWNGPCLFKQSIFENHNVCFLNEVGVVKKNTDWNSGSHAKLWLYNLHYFDDLSSVTYQERESIHYSFINRWIEENPACFGNGWEPYPLSLRLVNWVKWFSKKESVEQKYLNSIAQQAIALSQQLEYHILGNHLFANAKALTFVGAYLQGDEAESFLNLGLKILDREIKEQFLADGAHFELSPMYHEILLWDLLELIDLAKTSHNVKLLERLKNWELVAKKALHWLKSMIHPDGEVSFFNDAAIGIAASPAAIFDYASKLGIEHKAPLSLLTTNHASGYSRVQNDNYTLLFDHANVGPDYLPGHAHADSLSFEMSVGSQRIFVNSGTSLYGVSKERLRQRETSAHNTVVVDGQSSSEVWSGFRVARRAYTQLLKAKESADNITLSASHDGYKRLKPKVTHTRTINALTDSCIITDELSTKSAAKFNLHVHPDVEVKQIDETSLELKFGCQSKVLLVSTHACFVEESTWHPEFGKTIPNQKIVIPFTNGKLITEIKIQKE
ncbi:alginate lyase family protein [Pseudoalteromonas sp. SR41-6]|uniref:heparinase II/III family protein n=1 Tax=Pseudoalteromonas sp. SG41-8 TaxID=2760972 RepID=UPI001600E0D6|nr:heparinase II/III family protein [Pseudoalteromonas sp. SG41-8]MBB1335498.1 alginate lyase family protein [Pseudoalteromonas sp. SR41-6]MBB1461263.1 alginate lyase family protein [Pseudoalteromonas sp. SG41-8]